MVYENPETRLSFETIENEERFKDHMCLQKALTHTFQINTLCMQSRLYF